MSNETKGVKIGGVTPCEKADDTKVYEKAEEKSFTQEESNNQIRAFEDDIIAGLLAASDYTSDEQIKIEIVREVNGEKKTFFTFHVRPLTSEEFDRLKKRCTKYVKNKQLGIKMPDETDLTKYKNMVIYEATTSEDKAKLWDNKQVWDAFSKKGKEVITGYEVVELALKAGEKARIFDEIESISGFEDSVEVSVKN